MLVSVQFPICDARRFDAEKELSLGLPDWPNPVTDVKPQFVHHFGQAVERAKEPDQAWPDEVKFCRAKRAINFDQLEKHPTGLPGRRFQPQCAFRRLFFDGKVVCRVEVGIAHRQRSPRLQALTAAEALAIVGGLCELPSEVRQIGAVTSKTTIVHQGNALANLYARATLPTQSAGKGDRVCALVQCGSPLVLVQFEPGELILGQTIFGFTSVASEKVHGAEAHFGRLRTRSGVVAIWLLGSGSASAGQLRNLRICLMRVYAEQQAMDLVLKLIQRNTLPSTMEESAVERLNEYFNERTWLVQRKEWSGIGQSAIVDALDAADDVTLPGTRANFVNRYQGALKQVWKKVDEYQQRRLSTRLVKVVVIKDGGIYMEKQVVVSAVGSIVNIAEYMSNVTNTINNNLESSHVSAEAKSLINQLTEQINAISTKADPKFTTQMGDDLQTLSKEAAKPEPRRKWYALSLQGLKEAAEAVGAIAAPILATVAKLTPLLLA